MAGNFTAIKDSYYTINVIFFNILCFYNAFTWFQVNAFFCLLKSDNRDLTLESPLVVSS
jgi:hypothetical protein